MNNPQHNDGGPAFPVLRENDNPTMPLIMASAGMSLRDWFAGQALAGALADTNNVASAEANAKAAYAMADAMLKEREAHV